MKILEQHKQPLFELVVGTAQELYSKKFHKRCPPLVLWSKFPILSPYCLLKFTESPFNVLDFAAQKIILQENLTNPNNYNDIIQEIQEFYEQQYPQALFDMRIFRTKYHNIKGYFTFVTEQSGCGILWGWDEPEDEILLDSSLFEEEE